MEQHHQDHRFLSDLDIRPPSGLLPDNLDLSPNHTAFDSFDLRPSSPHFPATPSYNGSYHNSPYSAVSELDFDSKDDNLGLLNDPLVIPPTEDYDPAKYDPPSTGLLMFDDNFMTGVNNPNRVSVSITPADDASSPGYYDHPSPASSNGGAESGAENDRPSPASSVSSRLGVSASPHLDFHQLRVESPYHRPVSMPSEGASPQMKPQSPPVLVIPDLNQPSGYQQEQPVIHAPAGDGVGPHLHIVPATPVGGGEAAQVGGFRNNISQGPSPRRPPPPFCSHKIFVTDSSHRSQDQQLHQLSHRRVGPIIHRTHRQTPLHHSRPPISAPAPDLPAPPASHLTSLRPPSLTALRLISQLVTITLNPLLLLVPAPNRTLLSVLLCGILISCSTNRRPPLSNWSRRHLTLVVAGLG